MDSVALSLTSNRRKSTAAYRGRPGTGRSARRNLPGCGTVDMMTAGMSGHRGSTTKPLLASLSSRQSSAESQLGDAPQSIFDALIQLKVFTG